MKYLPNTRFQLDYIKMTILFIIFCFSSTVTTVNSSPKYLILAPKILRPYSTYNVAVVLFENSYLQLSIHATISCNNEQIASFVLNRADLGNSLETLPLRIPVSIQKEKYILKVEGVIAHNPIFTNITELQFTASFLSVTVQTSRPIYRAGQTVLFRVLILHTDLTPFDDAVEIHILDPDGFIMKRWISIYTNNGVASLQFKLPKMTKDGFWKIRIKAWDQTEEKLIKVETYFNPLFEVHIMWPPYVLSNEEIITAYISGLFISEKVARGNAILKLSGRRFAQNDTFTNISTERTFIKSKNYEFVFPMSKVIEIMGFVEGLELRLDVSITEFLYGETVSGYSLTRIIPSELRVSFLSSSHAVFRPGMPFHTEVVVSFQDNEKIPEEILTSSKLQIQATLYSNSGEVTLPAIIAGVNDNSHKLKYKYESDNQIEELELFFTSFQNENYLRDGVLPVKFDTRNDTIRVVISAIFTASDGTDIESSMEAERHHTDSNKYIGVFTSTSDAVVGEYAIFHVKSNFIMDSFQYLVVSKDQILYTGDRKIKESVGLSVSTLEIPLAAEMAPGFKLIVIHHTKAGEIITDSCFLPVEGFSRYEMEVELNTGKDLKAEKVEVRASGDEGAFIGVHAVRAVAYRIQAGNEMTKSRVVDNLFKFESFKRSLHKIRWKSRDGLVADESLYFPSMDYGRNARESLCQAGLVTFTTENIPTDPPTDEEKCGDSPNCEEVSEEIDCVNMNDDENNDYEYKISRVSRTAFLYDAEDGDWGWREIKKNDHEGIEFEPLWPPQYADDWYFTGFTVGKQTGFSIIPEPILFSYKRPFTMHVSGPSFCRRGEQLGIRLILVNNYHLQALVLVQLIGSPGYKFIHVEMGGIVSSYNARLSSGDHQILVYLAPESQEHIDFPITPTIEQGDIEIIFIASTQTAKSEMRHQIKVIGEGALITRHTSEFLDLKSRALSLHYLNIVVEETPIVSYQEWRRYVYGSSFASLTLTGDLIGPAFPETPVTLKGMLNRYSKGTESRLFEMAANVWSLHYLRLTNQLQSSTAHTVLEEINILYAHVMKRYNSDGWFYNWNPKKPNLWLTAWALRIFKHATFPDWENVLYIDPQVFARSITWLLKFQTYSGSFREYPLVSYIDSKMFLNDSDVSLTAHVLITLTEVVNGGVVGGEVRAAATTGIQSAVFYLERKLSVLSDPYLITISTYALTIANSNKREHALLIMQKVSQQNVEGLVYWSRYSIPPNPIKIENQRPFKQPRLYHEGDSIAVEATSWALLVNLYRDGVTDLAEKIVQWLTTIRMTCSGFISTVDTVVAMQALTEYAFRTRLLDITNISVKMNIPNIDFKKQIHIGNSSFAQPSVIEIPSVWGHVNVIARGTGQALVQLDVNYGVDYEPLKDQPSQPSFDLRIKEFYSNYRNKSIITIESCFRWVRQWPVVSGATVLEVELPTGYHLIESEAEAVVKDSTHPTLNDAKTEEGRTFWFFEYVEQSWSCFNHTIKRWYPVANMTLYRQAIIYEMTARERFEQVLVNSKPLYLLNICEVCGSYQCPYCPFYNSASHPTTELFPFSIVFGVLQTTLFFY
ncbi:CD109 antigen-like isoform X2 [Lycorma delicatula]|uniref:CD109 antigen-like isoform X2 n=1 Tax=Lycorma delicatula TaxID=130591 RepID=UPI003F51310F